jgi:hypothetical protein
MQGFLRALCPGRVGKMWNSDSPVVYPGHGDDTTLGTERPHLDEWQQRGW